jgi:hypothetical protein
MKNDNKLTLPYQIVYYLGVPILALLTIPYFMWMVGKGVVNILLGRRP